MKKKFFAKNYFKELSKVMSSIDITSIECCIKIIKNKIYNNNKIFVCGNGGSATTADHMITDLNKMLSLKKNKKFRGYSLTSNTGILTAYANDISYTDIFSEQLKSLMDKDDLLICLSGSGNSENVIKATQYAKSIGGDTMAIVGFDGGKLKKISKFCFHVQSYDMQICEDIHLMFNHILMKFLINDKIKKKHNAT